MAVNEGNYLSYQQMASRLAGFRGSLGTGEEFHDHLLYQGWGEDEADDFSLLIRKGLEGKLGNEIDNEDTGDFLFYIAQFFLTRKQI